MCIDSLAMATTTTLVAALYSTCETSVHPSFEGISPAIISLFETFWDERYNEYKVRWSLTRFDLVGLYRTGEHMFDQFSEM